MENCPERDLINFINGDGRAELVECGLGSVDTAETSRWLKVGALGKLSVEDALKISRNIKCLRCTSMVVDLSTAVVYCGLEVPQSVIDTNKRILAN